MDRIRTRLTYANVMSTIAVFLVLGGGAAYAAGKIVSSDIKNGEVKTADLADGAVTSPKVADNSLGTGDLADGSLKAEDFATGELPGSAPLTSIDDLEGLACGDPGPNEIGVTEVKEEGGGLILTCHVSGTECTGHPEEDQYTLPDLPNATAGCRNGHIVIDSCDPSYYDINAQVSDGCEYYNVFSGPEVCDGLDNNSNGQIDEGLTPPPPPQHAVFVCNGANGWQMMCDPEWEDANNDQSDGCEAARPRR